MGITAAWALPARNCRRPPADGSRLPERTYSFTSMRAKTAVPTKNWVSTVGGTSGYQRATC